MKRFILTTLMILSFALGAQAQYQVKGTIADDLGPVIGATVMEAGTTNGTSTDFDGNFSLMVS